MDIRYEITGCDDIKICTNLESHSGPLPKGIWFTPTFEWRLYLNLLLQPQNDVKLWTEHNNDPGLAFYELKIPEMDKKMKEICGKISNRYCIKCEQELLIINIPISIRELIGKQYLFIEPSIFKDFHSKNKKNANSPKWIRNPYLKPSRSEDGQIMDTNEYPPTNSLILESVASLSD